MSKTAYTSFIALLIALLTIVGLLVHTYSLIFHSLWLDELGTYILTQREKPFQLNKSEIEKQIAPLYPIFMYYWVRIFGASEVFLRIPSVLFITLSSLLIYSFFCVKEMKSVAAYAAVIFLTIPDIYLSALNARPYSLGVLSFTLALFFFAKWEKEKKILYVVIFTIALACVVLTHYLFAPSVLIFILYLLITEKAHVFRYVNKKIIFLLFCMVLFLYYNFSEVLIGLYRHRQDVAFVKVPEISQLSIYLISALLLSLYLLSSNKFQLSLSKKSEKAIVFGVCIFIIPPISLYVISNVLSVGVFFERYYLISYVGFAVLLGILLELIKNSYVRSLFFSIMVLMQLSYIFSIRILHEEKWREYANYINIDSRGYDSIVLLSPGFVEGKNIDWLYDERYKDNFEAPFRYYRLQPNIFLFPVSFTEESKKIVLIRIRERILNKNNVYIVSSRTNEDVIETLIDELEQNGFRLIEDEMEIKVLRKHTT